MTDLTTDSYPAVPGCSTADVRDYWALLKPRVMSLVVFTGFVGYWLAPGHLHPVLAAVAILCIAVGAGAAGAINMWYDRDIDAVMTRTQRRPLPAGRISPGEVLAFGTVLAFGSVLLMGLIVNPVAGALLALSIAFYVFVYTIWLKRRTPHNIVIGGAAGAFPPVIGWTAVTGDIGLPSLLLFGLIFFWTPPHSWALALFRSGDYARAGVPMLPVAAGPRVAKWQMLGYTVLLLPVAVGPYFAGLAGLPYLIVATLLGLAFVGHAVRVLRDPGDRAAKQMFGFSLVYLSALFATLMLGRAPALWS